MQKMKILSIFAILNVLLIFAFQPSSVAEIVFEGFSDQGQASVTLTTDLQFTLTRQTNDFKLILKDYFDQPQAPWWNEPQSDWDHSVNGELQNKNPQFMIRLGESGTEYDVVFALFRISGSELPQAGSTIVIHAGTLGFSSISNAPAGLVDRTFIGEVYLTDINGDPITDVQVVPEPSLFALALGLILFTGLIFRRVRRS